ncbi:MAG: CPBP family intramembrane metalloprotease, partial [Candidatus Freyarchaeota archaeon]|nr:CPBP family intramembrane metalloprotease [Candidatus Jordarchaeia archaeon]
HALLYLGEFALLYFYVKMVRKHSFSQLGFRKVSQWKSYAAMGFVFAVFHNIIAFIISSIFIGLKYGYYLPLYVHMPVYFAFYWIISISEEGIFRGCILGQLLHKYGAKTAMTVSSIMFGLYHVYYIPLIVYRNPTDMLFQAAYAFHSFTAGLFLAYFYYKTGRNLLGPVAYHFSQMFFNIPFLWMHGEVTFSSQIAALMLSSLLNFIQILALKFVRKAAPISAP